MNKKIIGLMSLASLAFSFFALSNNSRVIEAGAKVKITSSAIEQTVAKNQTASTTYSGTYYDSISATGGVALFDQLTNLIDDHTVVAYKNLATVYHDSDVRPDGSVWDIYGDYPFSFSDTGNYSNPGDTWNKEHLIPQSWFGKSSPMVSDAFHIYPSDGKINGIRSNYPLSEVSFESSKTYYLTSYLAGQNNGGNYKCGLGTSTVSGVADNDDDKAFEPADCYKGDFARSYFYFVTRYAKQMANGGCTKTSESTDVFNTNKSNFFLNPSYKELLLKWHHQDPVSYKEIDRCNGIYKHQKNRNPYIDHPEFVDAVFANGTYVPPVVTTPTLDLYTGTKGSEVKITTSSINKKVGDKFYVEVYVNGNGIFDTDNTITKSVSDSSVLSLKDYFYVNANIECLKAGTSTLTFKKSYQDGNTTKTVSKSLVINVTDDGSGSGTETGGGTTTGGGGDVGPITDGSLALITSNNFSSLCDGDRVVLKSDSGKGVTGASGKDATISSTMSDWTKYVVHKNGNNVTLQNSKTNNYIETVSDNKFTEGSSGGNIYGTNDGVLKVGDRFLYINGNYVRLYRSSSINEGWEAIKLYKVNSTQTEENIMLASLSYNGTCKTTYEVNEEFNATGINVIAKYSDNSEKDVTTSVIWTANTSVAGNSVVVGTYTEDGVSKTVQIQITINGQPPVPPIVIDDDDDDDDTGGETEEDLDPVITGDVAGCEGSVVASSLIISTLSLAGLGLVVRKKKEL